MRLHSACDLLHCICESSASRRYSLQSEICSIRVAKDDALIVLVRPSVTARCAFDPMSL
jgi:hypothetical protein